MRAHGDVRAHTHAPRAGLQLGPEDLQERTRKVRHPDVGGAAAAAVARGEGAERDRHGRSACQVRELLVRTSLPFSCISFDEARMAGMRGI